MDVSTDNRPVFLCNVLHVLIRAEKNCQRPSLFVSHILNASHLSCVGKPTVPMQRESLFISAAKTFHLCAQTAALYALSIPWRMNVHTFPLSYVCMHGFNSR